MKLAIAGKGGAGKTTLAALLAQHWADSGRRVLVADADPSPCLASALGFPGEVREGLRPVSEMKDLIAERTGASPDQVGGLFILNPRVDDIPERLSAVHRGVRLLEMGSVTLGGSGCICPGSALLKTLLSHLLLREGDVLILDLYAGVEHLGRATAGFVDAMLVVAEPTRAGVAAARQITTLATQIGIPRLWLVGNKVRNGDEEAFLAAQTTGLPVLGFLPADSGVREADRLGIPVHDHVRTLRLCAEGLAATLAGRL